MEKSYTQLIEGFQNPDLEYGPVMMWFWKGDITKEGITFQLEKFREQNVVNFFIHPAIGFDIPYLSDEHMELIQYVVAEAKRLGMHYWIYDEYEYPSGTAGGLLLEKYPEYKQKELHVEDVAIGMPGDRINMYRKGKFVYAQLVQEKDGEMYVENITAECEVKETGDFTEVSYWYNDAVIAGRALFYFCEYNESMLPSANFAISSKQTGGYVDMLNPAAVQKFIELTHERYKEFIGDEFGKTVRGVFTDEPTVLRHFDFTYVGIWSDTFAEEFEAEYGYSLLPYLYCFWKFDTKRPEEVKAIHDYRAFVMKRYHANFVKQISSWCKENNLLFTGHFGGEEIIYGHVDQGDSLKQLIEFDIPGMDSIFSSEQIDACIGFNIGGKLSSSAAKFAGADRVLCETYTGSGWYMRFPEMRRIANRLMMLGVNWIQYMGAYYTIDGNNKNFPFCYPSSHSYQNSLFPYYHILGRHMAAFSSVSAATKPDNKVLFMLPLQQGEQENSQIKRLAPNVNEWVMPGEYPQRMYTDTINAMLYEGIGFDMFSENLLDMVTVHDGYFEIKGYRYEVAIFPRMYYVNTATRKFIESLKAHNVKMIFAYAMPTVETNTGEAFDNGFFMKPYNMASGVMRDGNAYYVAPEGFPVDMALYRGILRDICGAPFLNMQTQNNVYITKRANSDAEVYFICNDDKEEATVYVDALSGLEFYDSEKGKVDYTVDGDRICLTVEPWGMLLAIRPKDGGAEPMGTKTESAAKASITLSGAYEFTAEGGNFLPIDYEMYDEAAGVWKECPFMSYALDVHIKAGAAYKLRSRVRINKLPQKVYLNAEVQRLTRLSVNGTDLAFCKNIDRWSTHDYTVEIASLLYEGENIIEVEGAMHRIRMHNKPPYIFLSGDFTVGGDKAMNPATATISANGWEKNGYPYYTGVGVYKTKATLPDGFGKATICVNTPDIAEIFVNGKAAGTKLWLTDETDITEFAKAGENEIEIRITSTRANSFACKTYIIEDDKSQIRTENGIVAPMEIKLY